jgi:taurine dioxygenase
MVREHHVTGEKALFVNRGWNNSIVGLKPMESMHLLEVINQTAERPELQIRWKWTSGDAALWDNRYTMHYALNDYRGQRRRARRATIYNV